MIALRLSWWISLFPKLYSKRQAKGFETRVYQVISFFQLNRNGKRDQNRNLNGHFFDWCQTEQYKGLWDFFFLFLKQIYSKPVRIYLTFFVSKIWAKGTVSFIFHNWRLHYHFWRDIDDIIWWVIFMPEFGLVRVPLWEIRHPQMLNNELPMMLQGNFLKYL